MAFECGICTAMFNAAQRQPLILECGHTFCRHCIQHSLGPQKWCPYCRQPITKHADDLPRNYALENAMEAANMPLMELMDRWGLANAERMMVKPDQLQLVNLISRKGNTGEVWRGTLWGKSVAVKLVPLVGVDDRQLDCLRREVAVLLHTTGECKQVCIYKGFCVKNGNFAIIMKLYSYSLAARVARHPGRRLPLPLALKYAVDIAKGLVELHRLGVTAADLKPDNVLIDDELGDAVIADFGISSVVTVTIGVMAASGRHRRGSSNGLRSSGAMRGTPNYMAPEQFTPGHKPTNKADIWGFAATLLHMLTGAPPWQHETLLQICTAVGVSKQSPPLPEGLPVQLEALMRSCFEADPARRPTAPQLLKALQTVSPMLATAPQLMHATSNLQRNSQLISAARGVLSGLQQDCCQLVQQLTADEQAAMAAAAAAVPGRLHAVAEDKQMVQQRVEQKQRLSNSSEDSGQAALDQYLTQLGLLSLMRGESSLGMPSAPPLPGGSSSRDPSRPGSSNSSRGGLGAGLNLSRVGSSSNSSKLPKVLWSDAEAVREEQEAQQQRRQQQQIQQQGLAANMGLASPRKVHHGRSVSEQVGAYNPPGHSSYNSAGYSVAAELQFGNFGDQQQQPQQQQGLQSGSSSSAAEQQQLQQHGRSMSEVCQIWGAREFHDHGGSSRKQHAGPLLPTHFESPLRGAEVGPSEAAAAAAEIAEVVGRDLYSKDDPGIGSSPAKQRKQWQIPAAPQQQQQQQDEHDQQHQQQQQQQCQHPAGMHGQSKWPGGLAATSKQVGASELQQQQQQLPPGHQQSEGAGMSGVPVAAPAAGPLTAAVAAHRSQHSISSASLLKASTSSTDADGPAAAAAAGADTVSNSSMGSSSGSRAAAAAVPNSPKKHTRTLSNLLLGRGGGSSTSSPCTSPGKYPASAVAARSIECDSRSSCNSTPERARRGSGALAGSSSNSILAQAALGAGASAGAAAAVAGAGVGTAGTVAGPAVAASGSALIGAAAAATANVSRGAAEAGRFVAPGVVASMAAKFSSGGGSSSGNSSPSSIAGVASSEKTSPGKVSKSRWRALFGGSPKKRSQTQQQQQQQQQQQLVLSAAGTAETAGSGTLCRSETNGSSSSFGSASSVLVHDAQLHIPARGCTGSGIGVGSRLGPHAGLETAAAAASTTFSSSMLLQQQQQSWASGDAACHAATSASATTPTVSSPVGARSERSPLRDQDCRSTPSPSRLRPADSRPAAAAAATAASPAEADATSSPSKDAAVGSSPRAGRVQGACSPLRSHVRNLSMPSKISGLGTSSTSTDQQRPAAGRASPLKQQQQQQQDRQPEAEQAAAAGPAPASRPARTAGSSSSTTTTSSSSNQTHSQMLTEAGNLEGMARQLSASGRKAEALRSALAIWIQQLGTSHPNVITATARLALHLHRNGKASDAEGLFREVLRHKQAMMGKKHPQVATAYANLAACLYSQEKYAAAVKMYGAALEIREATLGEHHADTASCVNNLALCYSRLGQHADAEALYRQALATRVAALGQSHPDVATTAHSLGHCLSQLGRQSEALVFHKQGLWVRQQRAGSSGVGQGPGRSNGDSGDAAESATIGKVRRSAGGASDDVVASHRNVALCLAKLGCDNQAEEHLAQVLEAKTGDVLALAVPPPPGVDHPPGVPVSSFDAAGVRHSRQASFAAAAALGLNPQKGPEDDVDWSFLADGDSRLSKPQQDALLGMAAAAEELARCFSRQGKHTNAEELYWQALEARSQVLGSPHELVQATEAQLRDCLDRQC